LQGRPPRRHADNAGRPCLQPGRERRRQRPAGLLHRGLGRMAGGTIVRRRLAQGDRSLRQYRARAGQRCGASVSPYTGWAGFNYDTGLPRARVKEVLLACAKKDIRAVLNYGSPGLIDLLDEVDREVPLKGRRWVIVHINILSPKDVERIVRMGLVITSHTNSNVYKRGHVWQAQLPPERHGENTPLKDFLSAGVKVGLITDNVPISLFWPIWQSVARLSRVTNERIAPEQALTRAEALRCATENGAYLTFDEDKKGTLEPGKLADLAVLSADTLIVAGAGLRDIPADMTMVGGKMVHQTPTWPG